MAKIDLKNATLTIQDGTSPTPNSVELTIGEGNLTFTETRNLEYTLNRGAIDEYAEVREADDTPVEVSFEIVWTYISGESSTGALPTPVEALKKTGNASAWVSTDSDDCRPYAVDILITYEPPCTGDSETMTLPDFRYEQLDYDLKAATISCSGKCLVTDITSVRTPQSA